MKKLIAVCLSLVMLFTLFPLDGFATENTQSEYDQLIALACEVFPEYSSAIRCENICTYSMPRSSNPMEVIYRETREISDTESMSIALLSGGNAIVIYNNFATTTYTSNTSDIGSVGVSGTASFKVSMNNAYFILNNVEFTIYETGSDYFTDFGSVDECTFYSYDDITLTSTHIEYSIRGTSYGTDFFRFKLYFENNKLIATA